MLGRFRLPLCFVAVTACWLPLRAAAQSPAPAPRRASPWTVLGRSLEDRVIEYRQFGDGPRQLLVIGPLEGDETAGLDLVESLAEHLSRFPRRASGARVTLVRDANPDGRLRRTAGNARGVLLNRNFPTQGWRKLPLGNLWLSGREPESEPEVRALVDLLDDVRPDCVVLLTATRRSPAVGYAGPAATLVRDFAKASGLRPVAVHVAAEQGSLAVYAGVDRKLPTLTVRVSAGMRRDVLWSTYKRGLLAVIGGDESDQHDFTPSNRAMPAIERESAEASAMREQPHALLATAKRPPMDGLASKPPAGKPRILSAEELQSGGKLVPVVPVRRKFGAATEAPPVTAPVAGRAAFGSQPTIRANRRGGFPPATLARPGMNRVNPLPSTTMPPATMPSKPLAAPMMPHMERLPPVGRGGPPASPPALPKPIPLYPETGF